METKSEEYTILDEVKDFIETYAVLRSESHAVAMTAFAAMTWGWEAFATGPRLLIVSPEEESGKTMTMTMTALLCANPQEIDGSSYAAVGMLAEAANKPEMLIPTYYLDEIGVNLYGTAGLNRPRNNPIDKVLKKGYKRKASMIWSVDRSPQRFPIFCPFIMTGLGEASVPRDVRGRCIVIPMPKGKPPKYFDVRDAEDAALDLGAALGAKVRQVLEDLEEFRAYRLGIPGLSSRKAEIWEGLFAVAMHLGGQRWVNMMKTAFNELALRGSGQMVLSPKQRVIRDIAMLCDGQMAEWAQKGFLPGQFLQRELGELGSEDYDEKSREQVGAMIRDALVPFGITSIQPRGLLRAGYPEDRMRGYLARDILDLWNQIRPDEMEDVTYSDEEDPFAEDGDDDGDIADFLENDDEPDSGARVAREAEPQTPAEPEHGSLLYPDCEDDSNGDSHDDLPDVEKRFLIKNAIGTRTPASRAKKAV